MDRHCSYGCRRRRSPQNRRPRRAWHDQLLLERCAQSHEGRIESPYLESSYPTTRARASLSYHVLALDCSPLKITLGALCAFTRNRLSLSRPTGQDSSTNIEL